MKNPTFTTRWNADVIDDYYRQWQEQPASVGDSWRAFFEGFELGGNGQSGSNGASAPTSPALPQPVDPNKQSCVIGAIYAYRSIGHTQGLFNPLLKQPTPNIRLTLKRLGLDESDLDTVFHTGNYLKGKQIKLRDLLDQLKTIYCGHIGSEYIHIQETPRRRWLQARIEPNLNKPNFDREKKVRIFDRLLEAEAFESFLQTRFVGQKRFGLEGGESIIPALDALIQKCPSAGVQEIVMGMAHRGRLNVLANIMGKSCEFIFNEFSENYVPDTIHGDGDVKYHLGYDAGINTLDGNQVSVRLAANPSHLEAVDPVVQGRARARQRILEDSAQRKQVLPVLIHGDAAFAGQGMVAETLNLSKLKGYTTGGTIHFIINNQIGFTTNPEDARSTRYCTDVAKMIEAPVFHVNGDDPAAMVYVTELALDYRQKFSSDVVIDMYCYRRQGHNEADEPAFTQPIMYKQISAHPLISETYARELVAAGDMAEEALDEHREPFIKEMDAAFLAVKEKNEARQNGEKTAFAGSTGQAQPPFSFRPVKTSVANKTLEKIARALTSVPQNFTANHKILRQLETKWKKFDKDAGIDWAFAESLAFGSLLVEGTPVRLSGQDSERGTFSQRHASLFDIEARTKYTPLSDIEPNQARFCVHNSLLSEAAVLGFDYGYSLDFSQMLCIWEAQFGDFANGAQVIIDQFITSSESKWQRVSGLVMLLPHGYEGQGPEHSSARLERFLQACAEKNIQVCSMTTPAQYFHVLRRQMKRDFRKPLIVMAPKSLLRHKECVSPVEHFTKGRFHEVLDDPDQPKKARRVILCSGKVYYDLLDYRKRHKEHSETTAIIRVEQLYPFHGKMLFDVLRAYNKCETFVWCQEESQNMGAWTHVAPRIEKAIGVRPVYAGRDASASTAVGSLARHRAEQTTLVEEAFTC